MTRLPVSACACADTVALKTMTGRMKLDFAKMQGLGNDFVVVEDGSGGLSLRADAIQRLGDRRLGVGFDQLLVLRPGDGAQADFSLEVFNADGSRAGHCGNGVRCIGRYIHDKGLERGGRYIVQVGTRVVSVRVGADGEVSCDMGAPDFAPGAIPLRAARRTERYALEIGDERVRFGAVSLGNPHAVIEVADVDAAPVARLGPLVGAHDMFPEGVNVGFMQIVDAETVRLRVFERGAGETRACGTGACAAVAVGHLRGLLGERVTVQLPGGRLTVAWPGEGTSVWMSGPATWVFEGRFDI